MRIYIDTETTGFDPVRDKIIEVGAVAWDQGVELGAFERLTWPGEPAFARLMSASVHRPINQVSVDKLRASPLPQEVAGELREFLARFPGASIHSYNVEFDRRFLNRCPWLLREGWGECVMHASARGGKWIKLGEATVQFGLKFEGEAHTALADAQMAAKVHWEILRRRSGVVAV